MPETGSSGLLTVIARSGSLATAAVLTTVHLYGQLQRKRADLIPLYQHRPNLDHQPKWPHRLRSWIVSTRLARHQMRFRMRDGSTVRCRLVDSGGLLSVH